MWTWNVYGFYTWNGLVLINPISLAVLCWHSPKCHNEYFEDLHEIIVRSSSLSWLVVHLV